MNHRRDQLQRARGALIVLAGLVAVALVVFRPLQQKASQGGADAAASASVRAAADGGPFARSHYPLVAWESVLLTGVAVEAGAPDAVGTFDGHLLARSSGAGIGGGEITFVGPGGMHLVRTEADGHFGFAPPAAGAYEVAFAQAAGFVPLTAAPGESPLVLVAHTGSSLRGIQLHLSPLVDIEGLVVNEGGDPVDHAALAMFDGDGYPLVSPWTRATTSDGKGQFRFSAPEDSIVEATHEGFQTARAAVEFNVRLSRRIRLVLRPGKTERPTCEITGKVVDERGVALAGVPVTAVVEPKNPASGEALANPGAHATSDLAGTFTLASLAEAPYTVTAVETGFAPAILTNVATAPGAPAKITLTVRAGGKLEGTVKDGATGAPLASFAVVVRRSTGPMTFETAAVRTVFDAAGHYEIRALAAGSYKVAASARDFAQAEEQTVTVDVGTARADFQLSPGARLTGTVRDKVSHKPLADASVSMEGRLASESESAAFATTTRTDDAGHYELTGLGGGRQSLLVMAKGHHGRVVTTTGGAPGQAVGPLDIELGPLGKDEEQRVELTGIGAVLGAKDDALVIGRVLAGGGAAAAGLGPGDAVLAVDGSLVVEIGFARAVDAIRGPEGTSVVLRVRKSGTTAAADVLVERRKIAAD